MSRYTLVMIILASLLLLAASLGSGPAIDWYAFTGGGGAISQAGQFTLVSAIGQPVAGLAPDENWTLCTGFLCEQVARYPLFLPAVRK